MVINQFVLVFAMAGHETTRSTAAHFINLMSRHPDQYALLRSDFDAAKRVILYTNTDAHCTLPYFNGFVACDSEVAGYDAAQIKSSGLIDLVGMESIVALGGGHDAGGVALQPLDQDAARAAILRQAPRVSAFAISASFGVRNPEHELQLRGWVEALCDKPVACGHELASSLGAPRRALTVALNARMVSQVKLLIDSVRSTLAARRIDAPLMIVKGDGSLINVESALRRPVGTVLSGPAASVLGACALSGQQDAIVADMGGTTTDIAVVRGGRPELGFDGAMVGHWRPMIEAVKVYAIGLGGDSEVRFGGGEGLVIGPRRVVPLSLLVHEH
ncbi:MAG: hypothetical protein EBY24_24520, partial [Betaproteobacteria bacterium]|nr:hypothetical protein [Betaproteobacteria bacterium]